MAVNRKKDEVCGKLLLKDRWIPYTIVRSARKTMSLQIKTDGSIWIRVPYGISRERAEGMLKEHYSWLILHYDKIVNSPRTDSLYTADEISYYKKLAAEKLALRVEHYASMMGVTYGRITIRQQKTRWGSCSSKGNLNFNWKLILMPEVILDYLVVHELAHRQEMNHSSAFWLKVKNILPDYEDRRLWLRLHGKEY